MKKKTVMIIAGVLMVAGGDAAIAAVGEKRGRFGHHGGPHGMSQMMGPMGMGFGMGGRGLGQRLKALDTNNDGVITLEEALAVQTPAFARLDKNGDGVIDAQELQASTAENVDYWSKVFLKRFDKDGDGKITREEFRGGGPRMAMKGPGPKADDDHAGPQANAEDADHGPRRGWHGKRGGGRIFDRFDLNSDGVLDATEVETMVKQRATRMTNRMVRRLDQDGDGRISKAEFERPARERFAARDINNDGRISEDDLPPMMRGRGILR